MRNSGWTLFACPATICAVAATDKTGGDAQARRGSNPQPGFFIQIGGGP